MGIECIKAKTWDKMYTKVMDVARAWLRDNQQEALDRYNYLIAKADWDKKLFLVILVHGKWIASVSIMESMN